MAGTSAVAPSAVSTAANARVESSAGDDAALVRRVQSGEMAAFDQLILKYRERLFSVVYNLTSNRADANDLTQEAFIRAFRSINKFKGKSSFFTWLYRIAVNTTITHLKRSRKRRFFSFEQMDEEGPSSAKLESLASRAKTDKPTFMRELQEKLNDALQKLSVKHRTVVVLYEIEGLSHQEIAEITKTSEGTVRSRLHYAKQQLRDTLKDYLEQ